MIWKLILAGLVTIRSLGAVGLQPAGPSARASEECRVTGTVTNVCVGKSAGVSMRITSPRPGEYRAIGRYSGELFGRFDVRGRELSRDADGVCLQFSGALELGGDDSGFPSGTRTSYVMTIHFRHGKAQGVYHIGPLEFCDFEQYGTMSLDADQLPLPTTPPRVR